MRRRLLPFLVVGALLGSAAARSAPTTPTFGIDRTTTPATVCLMSGASCGVILGTTDGKSFTPSEMLSTLATATAALRTANGALQQAAGLPSGYVDRTTQASGILPLSNLPLDLLFNSTPLTGSPTLTGTTPQMAFSRTGGATTFVGATATSVGLSSNEALPFTVQLGPSYATRFYIDPVYGNVGIGTTAPATLLDVNGRSIRIMQPEPTTSSTPCSTGQIFWEPTAIGVCIATNSMRWAALSATHP